MKHLNFLLLATCILFFYPSPAQHLEVEGKTKLTNIEKVTTAPENVVRKADGTLAVMTINPSYAIGDFAHGGVVFWVTANGQHGKVVSIYETGVNPWSNVDSLIGATAQSAINGAGNTVAIMMQAGHEKSAARLCADLAYSGFDDWYLPALDELDLIYDSKSMINATATANGGESLSSLFYWSSTEHNATQALAVNFTTGIPGTSNKPKNQSIRAIRAF